MLPTSDAEFRPVSLRILPAAMACAILLILAAYGNHFYNAFQFDDFHTIVNNPWVTSLRNIPLFFRNADTFSIVPQNRSYRPLVTTSLAFDYWVGGGLRPFWFHVFTFGWFVAQLGLMYLLYRETANRARPEPANAWLALFAATLYGVHPAIAETVNYIIQRADLYAGLGVVAGLVVFISLPRLRFTGLFLIPVLAGVLSKPAAAVFPLLLLLWIWWFDRVPFLAALLRSAPAFLVSGAASLFCIYMTPKTFQAGDGTSPFLYIASQPSVLFGYFSEFFFPIHLAVDSERKAVHSLLDPSALIGFAFLAVMLFVIVWCARRRETQPVAFGLVWFLIASLPTSLVPLAEIENDHRMYLPFVGLSFAVCWTARLLLDRRVVSSKLLVPVCITVLAAFAWGTTRRNQVWHTEESLWRDAVAKRPQNGRAWVSLGRQLIAHGDYPGALTMFEKADALDPNYFVIQCALGGAWALIGDDREASIHYVRCVRLRPDLSDPHLDYSHFLLQRNRRDEAREELKFALARNPYDIRVRELLLKIYFEAGDGPELGRLASRTLELFPDNEAAKASVAVAPQLTPQPVAHEPLTASEYINRSSTFAHLQKYSECIADARSAIALDPAMAMAWNNLSSCSNLIADWKNGEEAARHALSLRPDLELARKNLQWAQTRQRPR